MEQATMDKDLCFEQKLLSHVELCYSVALALTRNTNAAVALVKETLVWAWQLNQQAWDGDSLKMALLSELRGRYRRQCRAV